MRNKISEIRKLKGLSQSKLAMEAKISRPYLSKIENDKAEPTGKILFKIAEVLNTSVDSFCCN